MRYIAAIYQGIVYGIGFDEQGATRDAHRTMRAESWPVAPEFRFESIDHGQCKAVADGMKSWALVKDLASSLRTLTCRAS